MQMETIGLAGEGISDANHFPYAIHPFNASY